MVAASSLLRKKGGIVPAMGNAGPAYHFAVQGGIPLKGEVQTQSAKNAAVAVLAASLLNTEPTVLTSVPRIEEVRRLCEVAQSLGWSVSWKEEQQETRLHILPPAHLRLEQIDAESARKTRSAFLFLPALLARHPQVSFPLPGGCRLGDRSLLPHLVMLEAFGVRTEVREEVILADATQLHAADVVLLESGDTVTEHALLIAALADGVSTIRYASANYMVTELARFLQTLGVRIEGVGTTTLRVEGVGGLLHLPVSHAIGEDPTDAMFFIAAALVTNGDILIRNAPLRYLEVELAFLHLMGAEVAPVGQVRLSRNGITEVSDVRVRPGSLIAPPLKIHPRPYPGLNIDNLPFFAVIATQAEGETLLHDWVYEKRAIYYTELERLGASTLLLDPHRILIKGPTVLKPAELVAPPALRPASILLIAMLGAQGRSQLRHVYAIKRGYEALAERLRLLGADVQLDREEQ